MIKQIPHFEGSNYTPEYDHIRLAKQYEVIRDLMLDGKWRTVQEINAITGFPETSISSQIRNLRKKKFGSFTVPKRRRGNVKQGLYEYQVTKPIESIYQSEDSGQWRFEI